MHTVAVSPAFAQTVTPIQALRADPSTAGILTIDLGAIESNYRFLAKRLSGSICAGVVKADAYGLGARRVVPVLLKAGCTHFFVAQLGEALDLRPVLPDSAMLYVLNGVAPGAEATCAATNITPVLNSFDQLLTWSRLGRTLNRRLPAVIQIDTGMSRLGLSPDEIDHVAASPDLFDSLDLRLVMSHLACGDTPDHPANAEQRAAFETLRAKLPPAPASLANSAGIFLGKSYHYDLCRPGAALYGLDVGPNATGIRPVVALWARVAQIRDVPAGAHVGYGYTARAEHPMRLATLAVGYADGWPRHMGNAGAAWFDGVRLPIVGRVSMDSCTIDLTALGQTPLSPGGLVELIGPSQTIDAAAQDAGTIGYELLTRLGHRYTRVYR